ncbi:MAG: type IX secretion system membrane protein PorP/SprF [Bacteroidota bacterium]
MKINLRIAILSALFSAGIQGRAQQEVMISQYMFNPVFINPAAAGAHPYHTASLLYRKQWLNFSGAPVSQVFTIDGKLEKHKTGLGLTLINDRIGVSDRTEVYGNYSYHLKAGDKATLAMGLSAGIAWYKAGLTGLTVWDSGDHVFASDIQGRVIPNIGSGVYFFTERFYCGFSVPNLVQYKPGTFLSAEMNNAPQWVRHYYMQSGYSYTVSDNLTVKPSFLLKYVPAAPVQADLNVNVTLKKLVTVGVLFRTGDSFAGILELNLMKNLRLGYAYDYSFTDIRKYSAGSHEIRLAYDFGKQARNSTSPSFIR